MLWTVFIIAIIGAIPMVLAFIMATPETTKVAWGAFFGAGTYEGIQDLALRTGFDLEKFGTFSLPATLVSTVAIGWAWVGTWQAAPSVGGEIKEVKKAALIGVAIAGILIAIYYVGLPWLGLVKAYDKMFVAQYIWAYKLAYGDLEKIIHAPIFPNSGTLAIPLLPPIIQLLPAIGVAFWMLNYLPTGYLICSRYIFAWSFDRFFPEKFADVNARFSSPHWAIAFTWFLGMLGALGCYSLMVYGPAGLGAGFAALDTTWIWWFSAIPTCWAAIVLPYVRRDLYEVGFKLEVAGIPVISILGVLGFLLGGYIWALFIPAVPLWPDLFWLWIVWFIGAIVFLSMYTYNVKRGIDVKSIYAELPPA